MLETRPNARAALQLLFAYTRADGDPYGLDPDGDGFACEERRCMSVPSPGSEMWLNALLPGKRAVAERAAAGKRAVAERAAAGKRVAADRRVQRRT